MIAWLKLSTTMTSVIFATKVHIACSLICIILIAQFCSSDVLKYTPFTIADNVVLDLWIQLNNDLISAVLHRAGIQESQVFAA